MEFNVYPQYSVKSMIFPDLSQKKTRLIHEDRLKSLQEALASNEDVKIAHTYFVSFWGTQVTPNKECVWWD